MVTRFRSAKRFRQSAAFKIDCETTTNKPTFYISNFCAVPQSVIGVQKRRLAALIENRCHLNAQQTKQLHQVAACGGQNTTRDFTRQTIKCLHKTRTRKRVYSGIKAEASSQIIQVRIFTSPDVDLARGLQIEAIG